MAHGIRPQQPTVSSIPKASALKTCGTCQKTAEKMDICARCRLTYYCNRSCQQQGWPTHKLVCKPEKERREEAKKITFGFNQILKSRQETNHIGQQLEELDKELIDLIQHHPDKDLIEQFYFRSVPFDKQERRLEKRQNNLSVEDKAARERLRSELNNKIQINREKHKTIANKLDSPSFISTIQKIKKEAQKIVDLGGAGEKQKIAKKILENLPLLETCSDNEDIEDIFVLCCQKIPKEYVADLLKRRWKELSNPREVEARQEAWEKILPVYDKLASAFWDYFKAEGVNLRPSS